MTDEKPFHTIDAEMVCPGCRVLLLKASNVTNDDTAAPKAGDFSLCCECGCILRFDGPATAHVATLADLMEAGPRMAYSLLLTQGEFRNLKKRGRVS